MAHKIFVSYKYWDTSVYQDSTLDRIANPNASLLCLSEKVTPRSYLNELSNILSDYAIEKWEQENEDLSNFKEETIESKLRDKIYDSTITIVLISPCMRSTGVSQHDQWIPWEVAYSLKLSTRNDRTSQRNALLAVVLPDEYNKYDYCISYDSVCDINILKFSQPFCFEIIGENFFNKKDANSYTCSQCGNIHYRGLDSHYFSYATWKQFKNNPEDYIKEAIDHQGNIDDYKICTQV